MTDATTAPADWFGDPAVPHEPGIEPADSGWRPVCSCGFRAPLTHDTEADAMRAAETHAAASSPRPEGRYEAERTDEHTIVVRCRQHPDTPLLTVTDTLDGHGVEIGEAIRDHDREFHGDDRRA